MNGESVFQACNLEIISSLTTHFKFVEANRFQIIVHIQALEQNPGTIIYPSTKRQMAVVNGRKRRKRRSSICGKFKQAIYSEVLCGIHYSGTRYITPARIIQNSIVLASILYLKCKPDTIIVVFHSFLAFHDLLKNGIIQHNITEHEVPCTWSLEIEMFGRQTPFCFRNEHSIFQIRDKIPILLGMHLIKLMYSFRESMTLQLAPRQTGSAADTPRRCCAAGVTACSARYDCYLRALWLGSARLGFLDGVQECTVWEFKVQHKSPCKSYRRFKLSCFTWRHIQFKPEISRCPLGCFCWYYTGKVPESKWRVSRVSDLSGAKIEIVSIYACTSCTYNRCNGAQMQTLHMGQEKMCLQLNCSSADYVGLNFIPSFITTRLGQETYVTNINAVQVPV